MRIVLVGSDPRSGLLYHPSRLALALGKLGHEVHVLKWGERQQAPNLSTQLERANIRVHSIDALSRSSWRAIASDCSGLDSLLADLKPDAVQTFGPVSAVQLRHARNVGARRIVTVEAMGSTSRSRWPARAGAMLLNRYSDIVVALCRVERTRLSDAGVDENKLRVVHNPLDCDDFLSRAGARTPADREATLSQHGIPGANRTLGCFASFTPTKGQALLISVFASLARHNADWCLVLGGDGSEMSSCQALSDRLGIRERVHFVGRLSQPETARLLSAMDVVAHCSSADTFGYSMIEPLLFGIPTVITRVGIAHELADANRAVVIPPDDEKSLREALRRLLARVPELTTSANAGPDYVRHNFDVSVIATQLVDLYSGRSETALVEHEPTKDH